MTMIVVEIVYADAQRALVKPLCLPQGANLAQALLLAADDEDLRDLNLASAPLGIFGQPVQRDHVLNQGDRIEVYRPLAEDPKIARRRRAKRPQ